MNPNRATRKPTPPVTAEALRKYWHRSPFVPFNIVVPGRSKIHVPHPDFLTVSPKGRTAHIWLTGESWATVDVFLITALEERPSRAKQKRSRKRS